MYDWDQAYTCLAHISINTTAFQQQVSDIVRDLTVRMEKMDKMAARKREARS